MKKFTTLAILIALIASSSLALAQTSTAQNPYSWMPMFPFWGSQATIPAANTPTIPATQTGQANANASFQELWSQMPMFQFLNFSR